MTDHGRCSKCGAVCPHCGPRDGFSLKALHESVRTLVGEVLEQVHASQAQQDRLVQEIMHLDPEHIKRARRIWDQGGWGKKGKGYGYFKSICLRCADEASKDSTLDKLPPLYTD